MRFKIILAYDGTAFQGWQIQAKTSAPPTVQGSLQAAIQSLTGLKVSPIASGRTDSGVHAQGQIVHFDLPDHEKWERLDWRHALNALLPASIRVIGAERAKEGFHARKDAIAKTYIYNFWTEPAFTPPLLAPYVWACGPLDAAAMKSCFPLIEGRRDFASFQNAGTPVESTVRVIYSLKLDELPQEAFYPEHAPFLRLSISANGFLKQMARNIAGFLWKAGKGKISPANLPAILEAHDRQALAAPTAPPNGLSLAQVYYDSARLPFPIIETTQETSYLSPTIKARG